MSTIPKSVGEIEPKPWQTGLAPVTIGIFLWVAFFDQMGRRVLPMGALGGAFLGVMVGGLLAYLCLFRSSAFWSHRSGQSLDALSTSTFGVSGAKVVPGLLLGLGQVVLFAIAVGYAVELTFQGLVLGGLVEARALRSGQIGGAIIKSPLYLGTALFWAVATALVSLKFTRWIGYLMQFFPIFPALMLGGAMVANLSGLKTFRPTGVEPPTIEANLQTFLLTLQWVFAFSAMAGVMATDWGVGSQTLRDVRLGGWVGMAFAPAIIALIALISIAGYQGSKEGPRTADGNPIYRPQIANITTPGGAPPNGFSSGDSAPPYTFRAVMNGAFPNRFGALMLTTFGLGSLAPAVYASFAFGLRFKALGPGISRLTWTMIGTCLAWLLIVAGWLDRTEILFNLLGAMFGPVAGAFAADYRRQKGAWNGARRGLNPAGLLAWGVGLAVGLGPILGKALGAERLAEIQPAAVLAFVAAYLTYEIAALVGLESGRVETLSNPAS